MKAFLLLVIVALYASPVYTEVSPTTCLAQNIYFEARNQSTVGQFAVGQAVLNRVADNRFPDNICGVVYQARRSRGHLIRHKCQFSWFCDGKSDEPVDVEAWVMSVKIAIILMNYEVPDIIKGALYYHSDMVDPWWNDHYDLIATIGAHSFYRPSVDSIDLNTEANRQ